MVLKIKHSLLLLKQYDGLTYYTPSIKLMATAPEPSHPESATSLRVPACFCLHPTWIHQKLGVCLFTSLFMPLYLAL